MTDGGLKELAGFKLLVSLNLAFTRVTGKGVADLKKALPELAIADDPGGDAAGGEEAP